MKNLKYFRVEERGSTLVCIFNNEEFGNSFSKACAVELEKIISYSIKKNISNVLVTATGRIFCSGGNLKDYAKLKKKSDGIKINKYISNVLAQFEKAPFYTLLMIQGDCLGGGLEWLSAFDKVYSTPHPMFGMWQSKIALSWGWGGGHRLKLRTSRKDLKNLLLDAKTFSAYEALSIGLIDEIIPESLILKKSLTHLSGRSALPKAPISKIKSSNLKHEQKLFESLWNNPEHKLTLEKFTQK